MSAVRIAMPDQGTMLQSLIAGQNPTAQDPTLLGLLPKIGLAQSMIQQSSDTSPATKAQAFARLAQALSGNYLLGNTTDAMQGIINGTGHSTLPAKFIHQAPSILPTTYTSYLSIGATSDSSSK